EGRETFITEIAPAASRVTSRMVNRSRTPSCSRFGSWASSTPDRSQALLIRAFTPFRYSSYVLDCGSAALAARDCAGVELTHAPATMDRATTSGILPATRCDAGGAPTGRIL